MEEPSWVTRTRTAYDQVAVDYAELLEGELERSPHDLRQLTRFADAVGSEAAVLDVGCGPGRITGHLATLGLDAAGIDLSPGMVAEARRRHPSVTFEVGSVLDLPLEDGVLAGVVAWYSLIHLPPSHLPPALAEVGRVLGPGGRFLTAFQAGTAPRHIERAYGHDLDLDAWELDPDDLADRLVSLGFAVEDLVVREPEGMEKGPRGYLRARLLEVPRVGVEPTLCGV